MLFHTIIIFIVTLRSEHLKVRNIHQKEKQEDVFQPNIKKILKETLLKMFFFKTNGVLGKQILELQHSRFALVSPVVVPINNLNLP